MQSTIVLYAHFIIAIKIEEIICVISAKLVDRLTLLNIYKKYNWHGKT